MLFDDSFVLGHGIGGLGGLDDAFGGPNRFDTGEIIVVGRVPGSLYIDDFSAGQTGLEHILPLLTAEGAVTAPTSDAAGHAAASDDSGSAALALLSHGKDEPPAAIVLPTTDAPLAQFELDGFARPALDLSPVQPIDPVAPPSLGDDGGVVTMIGGRAYQSLSFLIIDTPFAFGDSHLPASLRPSVDALLGLTEDDNSGDVWILPAAGHGSWRLN